jgi:hypothetical protein
MIEPEDDELQALTPNRGAKRGLQELGREAWLDRARRPLDENMIGACGLAGLRGNVSDRCGDRSGQATIFVPSSLRFDGASS